MNNAKPQPAISGPTPASSALPYGLHLIESDDVAAVEASLRADPVMKSVLDEDDIRAALSSLTQPLLTQGPAVQAFENAFAEVVGAREAVACSSGTSALHLALAALDVREGDTCIVPAITFLSTATAARFCGAEIIFSDVDPVTGSMTAETLGEALQRSGGTARAVLPVHLAGRACAMDEIAGVAGNAGAQVVEDACHALGTRIGEQMVGGCSRSAATTFSFHPVKTIACGEGGMVTTNDLDLAERMRRLRNHGVTREADLLTDPSLSIAADGRPNPWSYEQLELGFNYRMTEIEGALGRSQLRKLPRFVSRRAQLAARYDALLASLGPCITPVAPVTGEDTSLHLYVVRIPFDELGVDRADLMRRLAAAGVGTQVHYIPVYRQPYFAARYGRMSLPGAESYYAQTLSLPLFPAMADADVDRVVLELTRALML
jgi:UDP-4-amino-4,6-dideoxy-N-acetyl-beta-L-altrosamine transaminase